MNSGPVRSVRAAGVDAVQLRLLISVSSRRAQGALTRPVYAVGLRCDRQFASAKGRGYRWQSRRDERPRFGRSYRAGNDRYATAAKRHGPCREARAVGTKANEKAQPVCHRWCRSGRDACIGWKSMVRTPFTDLSKGAAALWACCNSSTSEVGTPRWLADPRAF